MGQRGATPSPVVVINLYRHAALSPTLLAAGLARTHTSSPQGTGAAAHFKKKQGGGDGDKRPPWPGTDRRTNGLARVDLMIMCVCRVSFSFIFNFFFASAASNIILFFFFFFFPRHLIWYEVCVCKCVCVCAELYTLYMSDKMSELQINVQVRILFSPLEEN